MRNDTPQDVPVSVAEAREKVRLAIRGHDREIDRMQHEDAERDVMPCVDALIAAVRAEERAGNWTEDTAHENGDYQCTCVQCGHIFIGHKRRVTCKKCATAADAELGRAVWWHIEILGLEDALDARNDIDAMLRDYRAAQEPTP